MTEGAALEKYVTSPDRGKIGRCRAKSHSLSDPSGRHRASQELKDSLGNSLLAITMLKACCTPLH